MSKILWNHVHISKQRVKSLAVMTCFLLAGTAAGCGTINSKQNELLPEISTNLAYQSNDRYYHVVANRNDSKQQYVCYSSDEGETWNSVPLTYASTLSEYEFTFLDDKEGYLILNGDAGAGMVDKALYHTTDGGETWTLQSAAFPEDNAIGTMYYSHLSGIGFGANGVVIASEMFRGTGSDQDPVISWSHDYGVTWEEFTITLPRDEMIEKYKLSVDSNLIVGQGESAIIDGDEITIPLKIMLDNDSITMYYFSDNKGADWTLKFDDEL